MIEHVVIDHHLDEQAGVYVVVIGVPVVSQMQKAREDGTVVLDAETQPITESKVVGYLDVEDFVFDAGDPRWFVDGERRADEDVAADQRGVILDALAERAAVREKMAAQACEVTTMPGVGGLLREDSE